jgi:hypothetical protein
VIVYIAPVRVAAVLGGLGAILGAVLAVLVHFLTRRQPYGSVYVDLTSVDNGSFLIHPHWWPLTGLCVAGGLAVGLAAALGLRACGRSVAVTKL